MAKLYVVATPIGNLSDFTRRGIDTLKQVDLIAAEDTRVTRRLTQHFDIKTPLTSCHAHNEADKGARIAEQMVREDINVALTTDAGTPGISDPGSGLVSACVAAGIEVLAVPGACAMVSALSVSGMDTREFAFYGFLPRRKKELTEKIKQLAAGLRVAVVYEAPHRIRSLLRVLADMYPQAELCICCELTKLHESTLRGTAEQMYQALLLDDKAEKGEYCIVIHFQPNSDPEPPEADREKTVPCEQLLVALMLEGMSMHDAQKTLVTEGRRKNDVYRAALKLKEVFSQ